MDEARNQEKENFLKNEIFSAVSGRFNIAINPRGSSKILNPVRLISRAGIVGSGGFVRGLWLGAVGDERASGVSAAGVAARS